MDIFGHFIVLCWAILIIYWGIAAFSAKPVAEGKGWSRWGWRLPLLLAALLFAILHREGLLRNVGGALWHRTVAIEITADVVTAVGFLIALWARSTLGANWSSEVVFKRNHELVTRGPYAYVRHPIYSGVLLMLLGTAIFSGRIIAFPVLGIMFLGFWYKGSLEERLLAAHFPEYSEYKKRSKALIPFLL